jgi:hypothetical protein
MFGTSPSTANFVERRLAEGAHDITDLGAYGDNGEAVRLFHCIDANGHPFLWVHVGDGHPADSYGCDLRENREDRPIGSSGGAIDVAYVRAAARGLPLS